MKNKNKIILSTLICIILSVFGILKFNSSSSKEIIIEPKSLLVDEANGRYETTYEFGGQSGIGKQMLEKYFDKKVIVEKIDDQYYLSFTQLSSSMQNLTLNLDEKKVVGYQITEDDGIRKTYSYTLSKENIQKTLPFSVYVSVRGETFDFNITLYLNKANKIGEVEDLGERPAEFVPTLTIESNNEYEATKGLTFIIREAKANLGDEQLDVTTKAYYVHGEEKDEVQLDGNKLLLNNIGQYQVVYHAESSSYKTSLGNPTFVEKVIIITSNAETNNLAKLYENDIFPEGTILLASKNENGTSTYDLASTKMKKISDHFKVYGIEFVSKDGKSIDPSESVYVGIKTDSTYNRNKVVAYFLDEDGTLTKLNTLNGGSYVKVELARSGTVILCIPGVAFHMPIVGYILILVAVIILLTVIITTTIIFVKKKKRKKIS